jgi:DNA-binding transcriptional ArsR family regulator
MSVRRLNTGTKRAAHVFAALGDETRLRLVARLTSGEPLSISQLSTGTRMTRQAVTKHLHVLEKVGVAKGHRRGREQLWQLNPAQLREAERRLDRIAGQWEDALARLKASVERGRWT